MKILHRYYTRKRGLWPIGENPVRRACPDPLLLLHREKPSLMILPPMGEFYQFAPQEQQRRCCSCGANW